MLAKNVECSREALKPMNSFGNSCRSNSSENVDFSGVYVDFFGECTQPKTGTNLAYSLKWETCRLPNRCGGILSLRRRHSGLAGDEGIFEALICVNLQKTTVRLKL